MCFCPGYDIVYWKLEGKSPGVMHIPSLADGGEKTRYLEEYCRIAAEKEGSLYISTFHQQERVREYRPMQVCRIGSGTASPSSDK